MSSVSIILSIPNQTARPYFVTSVELAHQTSLRSPWTMMTYSNSPPSGEAGGLFSSPGHCAGRTTV